MKQSLVEIRLRQDKILHKINEAGSVKVSELSELLNVSELTIRRDLADLGEKGLIERFHGGAKIASKNSTESYGFLSKNEMNQRQKKAIARTTAKLISDGGYIFVNAGTTTLEIIRCLLDKEITIVTNNAPACNMFSDSKANLISTGGEYNKRNRSYSGPLATEMINHIYASACILGINGITASDGMTTAYYPETMINNDFISRCRGNVIVAADSSKIGKTYNFTTASFSDIDYLITDNDADKGELAKIEKLGVKIIIAEEE